MSVKYINIIQVDLQLYIKNISNSYLFWTQTRVWIFEQVLFIIWPLLATIIVSTTNLNFVPTMAVFLIIPNLYFAWKFNWKIINDVKFSLVMGLPLGIIIDYLMQVSNGWTLRDSFFGDFHLFGYSYLEQAPWLSLFALLVVQFYRLSIGEAPRSTIHGALSFRWLVIWHTFLFAIFAIIWFIQPASLIWNLAYLKVGLIIGVLPTSYALFRNPNIIKRAILPTLYFTYFSLIYEWVSLYLGHWTFPDRSQFVGYVAVMGESFPYEELLFWIVFGPIFCISYLEMFLMKK